MARPTAVICVVGLSSSLLGEAAPHITGFAGRGRLRRLRPVLPAVTCSVQSSMLTGVRPADHGIVANGWYDRELAEVQFWKQSNRLVRAEKVWETARRKDPSVTCAKLFWWYNMYSTADVSVTPRPIYKADGRKLPDVYAHPPELGFRLQEQLGTFPLFNFWGPAASIASSRWIADASIRVHREYRPTLSLIYLPHLDYPLQKLGPRHPDVAAEVRAVDAVVGELLDYFERQGVEVMIVSEYGIEPVEDAVAINRVLREAGLLRVRVEQGLELLDAGASDAFAVADHQLAHVYVKDPARLDEVERLCRDTTGVDEVLTRREQADRGLDHARSGELVLVASSGRWFSYDYWLDEARAPDFARTVDIHRKPGYDPRELFVDPRLGWIKLRLGWKLARNKLGLRTLFDVIPLDARLVRGSHGRTEQPENLRPLLITARDLGERAEEIECTDVRDVILEHLFSDT